MAVRAVSLWVASPGVLSQPPLPRGRLLGRRSFVRSTVAWWRNTTDPQSPKGGGQRFLHTRVDHSTASGRLFNGGVVSASITCPHERWRCSRGRTLRPFEVTLLQRGCNSRLNLAAQKQKQCAVRPGVSTLVPHQMAPAVVVAHPSSWTPAAYEAEERNLTCRTVSARGRHRSCKTWFFQYLSKSSCDRTCSVKRHDIKKGRRPWRNPNCAVGLKPTR